MPSSHKRSPDHGGERDHESDARMSGSGSAGRGREIDESDEEESDEESGAPGVPDVEWESE